MSAPSRPRASSGVHGLKGRPSPLSTPTAQNLSESLIAEIREQETALYTHTDERRGVAGAAIASASTSWPAHGKPPYTPQPPDAAGSPDADILVRCAAAECGHLKWPRLGRPVANCGPAWVVIARGGWDGVSSFDLARLPRFVAVCSPVLQPDGVASSRIIAGQTDIGVAWSASAAHSAITVNDQVPASTAHTARPKITASRWRTLRRARGSWTVGSTGSSSARSPSRASMSQLRCSSRCFGHPAAPSPPSCPSPHPRTFTRCPGCRTGGYRIRCHLAGLRRCGACGRRLNARRLARAPLSRPGQAGAAPAGSSGAPRTAGARHSPCGAGPPRSTPGSGPHRPRRRGTAARPGA